MTEKEKELEQLKKDFDSFFEKYKYNLYSHKPSFDELAKLKERLNRLTINNLTKTAKWGELLIENFGGLDYVYVCDNCGEHSWEEEDYCCHCGARMLGIDKNYGEWTEEDEKEYRKAHKYLMKKINKKE